MVQANNNQNNNQVNSPFSIEPMDIPASINTFLNPNFQFEKKMK